MTPPREPPKILAAIDVGTNAVRLKIARVTETGERKVILSERDAVRPGEGVFQTQLIAEAAVERLIFVMKRYRALSDEYGAAIRAVATSAFRDAQNAEEIVERVEREADLHLEVISGVEEARLACLGALQGAPADEKNTIIDIGGGSTEVGYAVGDEPATLWSLGSLGALRITDHFGRRPLLRAQDLTLMRRYAARACEADLPSGRSDLPKRAIGTSGSIRSLVPFAASDKSRSPVVATHAEIRHALAVLARMHLDERRQHFEPHRAEVIVGAAAILDAVMEHLGVTEVRAVDGGLRDGILVDMQRRARREPLERIVRAGALEVGRRFTFDEEHGAQVARLATRLFDLLKPVHHMSRRTRILLETAALLHDVGYAIHRQRHHRHSAYIIENADLPGLNERERLLVSRLARYHRRSAPKKGHTGLAGLDKDETRIVQRLAPLLRLADSLDRSHHRMVDELTADISEGKVHLVVHARRGAPLEVWDAQREGPVFLQTYESQLEVDVVRT